MFSLADSNFGKSGFHKHTYCEIILICGAFNNVEFGGKTIHEFKYQQYKIPSVRLSNVQFICKSCQHLVLAMYIASL